MIDEKIFPFLAEKGHVISLVGGGGKTTLMYNLAAHCARKGWRVLAATTTHIMQPPGGVWAQTDAELFRLWKCGSYAVAGTAAHGGKLTAPPQAQLERWMTLADIVLIEADGAKRMPCKAPAAHEPVLLPQCDTVPDLIHQVVYNLLDNAIKFTPAGGTIRFGVEKLGPEAEISIWNSGQGISPEALPYVFQRFYKEDRSRGLHARGAGLGLNICKVLVNLSGGQIRVESQQGEWCRFVFTLPTVAPNPGGMKRLPDEAGGAPAVEDPASMKPVE